MTLPANWTAGQQFTAANENTVETAVNTATTTLGTPTATPTASTIVKWDVNSNLTTNNLIYPTTSITSAASTTYLTIASTNTQIVTGTTTQIVVLPITSVTVGMDWKVVNQSTGAVTVACQSSSGVTGATIVTLAAGTVGTFTAAANAPATAAGWKGTVNVAGKSLTVNNSLTLAGTDGQTFTFPATGGNVFASTLAVPQVNLPNGVTQFNTSQYQGSPTAGTIIYIPGSALVCPTTYLSGLQANKTTFIWDIALNKNAQGTGTFSLVLYRGINGTTADTADVTQLLGTHTAAVDNMTVEVQLTIVTTGASGAYFWSMVPTHLATTATGFGIATGPGGHFSGTVSAVNLTLSPLTFGIGFVSGTGGTLPQITIPQVQSSTYNLD